MLVRSARLYISGQNLIVMTKYKGIDPELRTGAPRDIYGGADLGLNLSPGVNEISFYPRTRTFVIGLNVSF
jgi:iron complex outermembrane receptor protein